MIKKVSAYVSSFCPNDVYVRYVDAALAEKKAKRGHLVKQLQSICSELGIKTPSLCAEKSPKKPMSTFQPDAEVSVNIGGRPYRARVVRDCGCGWLEVSIYCLSNGKNASYKKKVRYGIVKKSSSK